MEVVATVVQNSGAIQKNADFGFLQENTGAVLTQGTHVYVPSKAGYVDPFTPESQTWSVQALEWQNGALVPTWKISSDWKPVDAFGAFTFTNGYEQMFQPVLAGGSLYVPAIHGTVLRVNAVTGAVQGVINPFAGTAFDGDDLLYVHSALSVSPTGKIFYTAVALPTDLRRASSPRSAWLVEIGSTGSSRLAPWTSIALSSMGVKTLGDTCSYPFGTSGTPGPTGPDSMAPVFACGAAGPKRNAAVAFTLAGNPLVWSANNNSLAYQDLIEVSATTLAPLHRADLTGHLLTGCGVRQSIRAGNNCDKITAHGTTNIGFVSDMNQPMTLRASDIESSAPAIAPDGSWVVAGYDGGFTFDGQFDARGSVLRFGSTGLFLSKNESFGWNTTVGVWQKTDGSWNFIQDDQHYSEFLFRVARLDENFVPQTYATIDPDFNEVAIDALDAQPAFDTQGSMYSINGDGHLRKFDVNGVLVDDITLPALDPDDSDGINDMETNVDQLSWGQDSSGASVLFVNHGGIVYAVRGTGGPGTVPVQSVARSSKVIAGRAAKLAAAARGAETVLTPPQ
jgi:hypothetical protein